MTIHHQTSNTHPTTIAAVATAPGRGGVGIVRVSGTRCLEFARSMLGFIPQPRYAHYCPFHDTDNTVIDEGIALFFPGPHSFTGEDVLEFQGHGGPVVLDMLLQCLLQLGASLAEPGEFSERAFLNDKIDLTQAEAIADLIESTSAAAAKQALHSLQGAFSKEITQLQEKLTYVRMYVESAIDFPEEEIDFLADKQLHDSLDEVMTQLSAVSNAARQGALLQEGMKVVIAGRPNAGKSSLLNALSGKDSAIVTDIEGTTRDILEQQVSIDGMPLHIVDTAGLRESEDLVEQIGIERAWKAIDEADQVLLLIDVKDAQDHQLMSRWPSFLESPLRDKVSLVFNKIDTVSNTPPPDCFPQSLARLYLSALTGQGLNDLRSHLKNIMKFEGEQVGLFSARRRHLDALSRANESLIQGRSQLQAAQAGELLAEDLRLAQQHLSGITGTFTADDLLGEIFSSFCIGK